VKLKRVPFEKPEIQKQENKIMSIILTKMLHKLIKFSKKKKIKQNIQAQLYLVNVLLVFLKLNFVLIEIQPN
jgi:hypothetical protein